MAEHLRVMIVGKGAREHAISEAYERSRDVKGIVVTPGNDLIGYGRQKEVIIDENSSLTDPDSVLALAEKYQPDIVDVAQDDALAAGTVDLLEQHLFAAFGPTKAAARIESDKGWSRKFMEEHGIPSPRHTAFSRAQRKKAEQYALDQLIEHPDQALFIKAAGLCAGKGALRAENQEEALSAIAAMEEFGPAGEEFVIEQGLEGEEFSYYTLTDGVEHVPLKSAQDNKLSHDNDTGEQTGGMGSVSPAEITAPLSEEIERRCIVPMLEGLREGETPFKGVIYLGGILTEQGIMTIEYNARWGDPEVQAVLAALKSDYVDLVEGVLNGELHKARSTQDDLVRVCVVGASKGYPGDYSAVSGCEITGLAEVIESGDVSVYGAAVNVRDGKLYANGGRLFSVVGAGADIEIARNKAYQAMEKISVEGGKLHYRTDIGRRDLERHQASS